MSPAAPTAAAADTLAEDSYHEAFKALARGERALALRLLQALIAAAPQNPLAARARLLSALLAATQAPLPVERAPAARDTRGPRPTATARAEVVFFQTVHGIALGAEVCAMARCEQSQPWVASLMLGAGAGLGASFALTADGVTPGLARATTDGTWWGAANGLGLLYASRAIDHDGSSATAGAFLALGQLSGLGLGSFIGLQLQPSAGQVSLTASGGLWSLVVGGQFLGALKPSFGSGTWAALLLGVGNAGVLGGGLLARAVPMATSRVLLIDAGGLLGTLSGLGIALLAQGKRPDAAPTLAVGLVGTLGGLALAYHLTSGWDHGEGADSTDASLGLAPLPGGLLARLQGRF